MECRLFVAQRVHHTGQICLINNSCILKTSSEDLELVFTKYEESLDLPITIYLYLGVPSFYFEKQRCIMFLGRDVNEVEGIEVYSVDKS